MRAWTRKELRPARKALLARRRAAGEGQAAAEAAVDADLDQLFTDLLAKAERRFLHLAFLVDRIIERDLLLDRARIDALPAPADLFTDYLDRLPDAFGPKQAEFARLILLTLAAAEQAHRHLIEDRPPPLPVDADWRGLPLDALADLSHQPDPIRRPDADLILLLYRLRAALGTWRGEAAPPPATASASRACSTPSPPTRPSAPASPRPTTASPPRPSTSSSRPKTPPPRPQPPPARPGCAMRWPMRGSAATTGWCSGSPAAPGCSGPSTTRPRPPTATSRLTEAHQWWTLAIQQAEAMQAADDPIWRNHLAAAYSNRGLAKQDAGGHGPAAAVADYDQAIALREDLRALLEPHGRWEPALRNDLANAYMNRGNAKQDAGGHGPAAAVADYDQAIALMADLRALLEPHGRWEPALRNHLAAAYMNRGNAKQHAGGHGPAAAVADYDQAIALMADLRALLEPHGRWEPALRNDLANAYMNRGNAKQHAGGHGPAAAVADYDQAIALMADLRALLEPHGRWEPALRNDLATAYMNRGNAKQDAGGHGPAAAVADYDQAIALRADLRALLEPHGRWEPALRNDLAACLHEPRQRQAARRRPRPGRGRRRLRPGHRAEGGPARAAGAPRALGAGAAQRPGQCLHEPRQRQAARRRPRPGRGRRRLRPGHRADGGPARAAGAPRALGAGAAQRPGQWPT